MLLGISKVKRREESVSQMIHMCVR